MIKQALTAIAVTMAFASPAAAKKEREVTGLELQQIQSRDFEADKEAVFPSVMSVLQDAGYRIQSADKDTGLITGSGSTSSKMTWKVFQGFGRGKKTPVVSAFLESIGPSVTRVRLSFVMSKTNSSVYGMASADEEPISDPVVYQEAFEKIDKAIFVRRAMAAESSVAAPAAIAAPAPAHVETAPSPSGVPGAAATNEAKKPQ